MTLESPLPYVQVAPPIQRAAFDMTPPPPGTPEPLIVTTTKMAFDEVKHLLSGRPLRRPSRSTQLSRG